MGHSAEAAVYSYIGIALYAHISGWWSVSFIIASSLIIIIGRVVAIFGCFYLFNTCFRSRTINPKELLFISWGGMIRGAIAFALVIKIPLQNTHSCIGDPSDCFSKANYELMVSTTLAVVYVTTLVFGTFMAIVQKVLVPPTKQDLVDEEDENHESAAH